MPTTNSSSSPASRPPSRSPLSLAGLQDASTLVLPSEVPAPVPVPAGRGGGHRGEGDRDDGGGVATYPVAADATTMQHVRTAIDDLDRKIVSLLGQRMRYIEAAARIKPNRAAVRDQWRIDDVISKAKAQARKVDFPEELTEAVYATLIEGCVQHEDRQYVSEKGDL